VTPRFTRVSTVTRQPERAGFGIDFPVRVLLIDGDAGFAARVHATLVEHAPGRVWLWHERTPALALTLLSLCEFDLIVVTLRTPRGLASRLVHALAETALGSSLLLLRGVEVEWRELAGLPPGVFGVANRDDLEQICEAVARVLGQPPEALVRDHARL